MKVLFGREMIDFIGYREIIKRVVNLMLGSFFCTFLICKGCVYCINYLNVPGDNDMFTAVHAYNSSNSQSIIAWSISFFIETIYMIDRHRTIKTDLMPDPLTQ